MLLYSGYCFVPNLPMYGLMFPYVEKLLENKPSGYTAICDTYRKGAYFFIVRAYILKFLLVNYLTFENKKERLSTKDKRSNDDEKYT